jgi:hypothetical protein
MQQAQQSATAGIEFLVLYVAQSMSVPEFQGHPGHYALTAAISCLEIR